MMPPMPTIGTFRTSHLRQSRRTNESGDSQNHANEAAYGVVRNDFSIATFAPFSYAPSLSLPSPGAAGHILS
jgi:hypothetical protein